MATNPFAVFPFYSDLQLGLVILNNSKYLLSGCFAWNSLPEYSHANGTAAWSKKQLLDFTISATGVAAAHSQLRDRSINCFFLTN
ncbi:hypothetical protein [Nostoc sp. 'Lobaria pulmonaria (5183) cyanobiont']|uniref:hypothetical protein n=1 Tax=Nostoc sp. 'Lobaria pulmonaria (5183) cyanobiont' TaxID=1618022 RepID=UPI0018F8926E|nr:hypothetical protein [Nostoc sp. 'Lobaria pulmonaria (5183) cyanobiont']